jgi:hypothetical protein
MHVQNARGMMLMTLKHGETSALAGVIRCLTQPDVSSVMAILQGCIRQWYRVDAAALRYCFRRDSSRWIDHLHHSAQPDLPIVVYLHLGLLVGSG